MGLILGLDVSTACTGWCILDESSKLVDIGAFFLEKKKGLYKKAEHVRFQLSELFIKYKIEKVYIEESSKA